MNDVLNKSKNYFRCVGVVNEISLEREACGIKLKDEKGNDTRTERGEAIKGKVSIRANDGIYVFDVYFQSLSSFPNKKGEHDNPQWKMAESMLNWNPEINGNGGEPTLVSLEGVFQINDYLGQDGNVKSGIRYTVRKATTTVKDPTHGFSWKGNAFINSIRPEVINENETGRLVVELYGANGKGECFPMTAYVEKDLAEDFEDAFEPKQTVPMDIDVVSRHIGSKQNNSKKAFGRNGSINVNNGFDVTEMIIVGADEAIEEPEDEDENGNLIDNGYIDPKVMAKAIKARAIKLDEIKNNPPERKKESSIKEAKKSVGKPRVAEPYENLDEDELF